MRLIFRSLLIFILSLLWVLPSQAKTLDELQNTLKSIECLRADFSQEKSVKELGTSLKSSGRMLLDSKRGLVWLQTVPFEMQLNAGAESFTQRVGKTAPVSLDAKSNPQLFEIVSCLFSVLRGDSEAIEKNFDLRYKEGQKDSDWSLLLTPKTSALKMVFRKIELTGQRYIEQVKLYDSQDETTSIVFSNIKDTPDTLTSEEEKYFEQ